MFRAEKLRADSHALLGLERHFFVVGIPVAHRPASGALRRFGFKGNFLCRKPAEDFLLELRHQVRAASFPPGPRSRIPERRLSVELVLDFIVGAVRGELGQASQVFRGLLRRTVGLFGQRRRVAFEPALHPLSSLPEEQRWIAVLDVVVHLADPIRAGAGVQIINLFRAMKRFMVSVGRKNRIFLSAQDEQRSRRDEGAHNREIPQVSIVIVDTIALPARQPVLRL